MRRLYEALETGDAEAVQRIFAPDLEWWFHGPPAYSHCLMSLLTGNSTQIQQFSFIPQSVTALGNKVVVEGREDEPVYWIHVWTVDENGIVTQVREYFNTSLVVTDVKPSAASASSSVGRKQVGCSLIWKSELGHSDDNSMPGLVLAI